MHICLHVCVYMCVCVYACTVYMYACVYMIVCILCVWVCMCNCVHDIVHMYACVCVCWEGEEGAHVGHTHALPGDSVPQAAHTRRPAQRLDVQAAEHHLQHLGRQLGAPRPPHGATWRHAARAQWTLLPNAAYFAAVTAYFAAAAVWVTVAVTAWMPVLLSLQLLLRSLCGSCRAASLLPARRGVGTNELVSAEEWKAMGSRGRPGGGISGFAFVRYRWWTLTSISIPVAYVVVQLQTLSSTIVLSISTAMASRMCTKLCTKL